MHTPIWANLCWPKTNVGWPCERVKKASHHTSWLKIFARNMQKPLDRVRCFVGAVRGRFEPLIVSRDCCYVIHPKGMNILGFIAKPEKHLFFRRIEPLLRRHLEKAERENGFIYHDKVPDECPLLDSTASYGLAKLESFSYPNKSEVSGTFVRKKYF